MNTQKYTQKTLEALRSAQTMAQERQNQYLTPEHLLLALLEQDGGLVGSLFQRMGVDCGGLETELKGMIDQLPRVSGRQRRSLCLAGDPARSSPWQSARRKSSMTSMSPWSI